MTKFLHELSRCADVASIHDWAVFLALSAPDRAARLQELRDPLSPTNGRFDHIVSVCGLSTEDNECNVVYFWHEELHQRRRALASIEDGLFYCLQFFTHISSRARGTPRFEDCTHDSVSQVAAKQLMSLYGNHIELHWYVHNGYHFVALVRTTPPASSVFANRARSSAFANQPSSKSLLACHFDYYLHRSPLSTVVPRQYITRLIGHNAELVKKVLVDPRYFTPWARAGAFSFLWPWQMCIVEGLEKPHLDHKSIPTCSLVFDLRRSYLAMELLRQDRASSYAIFISKAVEIAKQKAGYWGGYFDKETGDGIIAHFVNSSLLGEISDSLTAEERAFNAAREIVEEVGKLCESFQENLTFEVEELGASVGIHSGTAAWLYTVDRIIAVGDSVVIATRLCSEAPPRSVFLSVPVFMSLKSKLSADDMKRFSKKRYKGKEYNDRTSLSGYCHS